ncbi:MFS transporter [Streptomyces sp. NPDC085466]|uniref:MFS transporter n=1 Tax=Streptomyces sp. NPDC085466 TaxID=3365725 RepID=UPI0037D148A7
MTSPAPRAIPEAAPRRAMWPLYAAGFTTAFGAHGIAANLGGFSEDAVTSLLVLGGLLALYDGAEVLLKPVFGSLADRVGGKPVLLGGLIAFAAASALYAIADSPGWLWAARLGQGAAASAFSPSASAMVARLNPSAKRGRALGSYGFYKSIGYTLGPLLGGVLVWAGGLRLLFTVMALCAAAVAVWAVLAGPAVPPLPRKRQTVADLARRLADRSSLAPTAALAAATAALSVGVGFLPVTGAEAGLGTVTTGAAVSVLAATAAIVQPKAGTALDAGRLTTRTGLLTGLLITAAGLAAAMLPGLAGILLAAALIGTGTGLTQLVDCWVAVTNAGGAAGFPFPPVRDDDVEPVMDELLGRLDPPRSRLLVATYGEDLAGWVVLRRDPFRLVAHWGTVHHLQTHPDFRGRGIGSALAQELRGVARDELGLGQLRLAARGEEGLETFYSRLGWREVGRGPDALRFSPDAYATRS